jgi:lipoate-protein ligase A
MIPLWRFINSEPASGASNMGLDEAILIAHAAGQVPPTVRVYSWERPTLSLGYAQGADSTVYGSGNIAPLLELCRQAGVDVVRRPTGGRAILHHLELTYSVVISTSLLGNESSIIRSYRFLCAALVAALKSLGIEAQLSTEKVDFPPLDEDSPRMCFAAGSRSDIVVKGAKIIGSAQARKKGVLLQHGSIPLRFDEALQTVVFGQTFRQSLTQGRITSIEREADKAVTYQEVARAVRQGFQGLFACQPDETSLTTSELALSQHLAVEKYLRPT